MVAHPDGTGIEQFVLCRSKSRREKEAAMLRQKFERPVFHQKTERVQAHIDVSA
jgi:hypothetical protein